MGKQFIHPDSPGDSFVLGGFRYIDPDYPAASVKQWSARISRIEWRVDLVQLRINCAGVSLDHGTDDSGGDLHHQAAFRIGNCAGASREAHGEYPLGIFDSTAQGERSWGAVEWLLQLQDSQVFRGIGPEYRCGDETIVLTADANEEGSAGLGHAFGGAATADVIVGDDLASITDDKTTACRDNRFRALSYLDAE